MAFLNVFMAPINLKNASKLNVSLMLLKIVKRLLNLKLKKLVEIENILIQNNLSKMQF